MIWPSHFRGKPKGTANGLSAGARARRSEQCHHCSRKAGAAQVVAGAGWAENCEWALRRREDDSAWKRKGTLTPL